MALPLLVNGAECGPINPLQGLSKRFDQDRGIQQDHFGASRAGSSREAFRTQYAAAPGVDQDASRFFSANQSSAPPVAGPSAYDLSALHASLPIARTQTPVQSPPIQAPATAPWAADFVLQQKPSLSSASVSLSSQSGSQSQRESDVHFSAPATASQRSQVPMQWSPPAVGYSHPNPLQFQNFALQNQTAQTPALVNVSEWDQEFRSLEASLDPSTSIVVDQLQDTQSIQETRTSNPIHDADELARTAGVLIEAVQNEQNLKFKNSAFLGLMRQVRDREIVIEGNDMVQKDASASSAAIPSGWASDFQSSIDVKGKGRAVDRPAVADTGSSSTTDHLYGQEEDPVDAYFRQENDDYINYWHGSQRLASPAAQASGSRAFDQNTEWDQLQRDWDAFEATSAGLAPAPPYEFQANNPYVHGEVSRTRQHMMHSEGRKSLYETVLEMEAAVQQDRTNALAWFELGVRQQENEREQKAVQALRRALELDPTHLPSWLALSISYTNEGNRSGTYEAIRQWVDRNDKYRSAVSAFHTANVEAADATQSERISNLVQCLISMARSSADGEIDPDIQIALAVLLNTNEDYDKAQDCFTTALAVRPEDWQLYNRVGATLANSGHPSDALQYYYRALELNPAYIRARFNLGISCISLRQYSEAAQHILDALVLQDGDSVRDSSSTNDKRGVGSSALWDCLKTCCLHMQRIDLATLCDQRDLDAFRLNYQMQ